MAEKITTTDSQEDPVLVRRVDALMSGSSSAATELSTDPDPKPESKVSLQARLDARQQSSARLEVKTAKLNEPTASEPAVKPIDLEDATTEAAVEQIAKHDSDEVLAAEDAAASSEKMISPKRSLKAKLVWLLKNKWTYASIAVILVLLAAVPWSSYKLASLVIHKQLSLTVLDSQTATAVSGATVSFDGQSSQTNASGQVRLKVGLGSSTLSISKQYYKGFSQKLTVGFGTTAETNIHLIATGRQVPITVINTVGQEPVVGAEIKVLNTTAKTNKAGQATIVLPTNNLTDTASVSDNGFDTTSYKIAVTSTQVSGNILSLTPTGQIYFLSNLSGKLDVIKTNLDGSDRQTVLAGTGSEDPNTTQLLASSDWRYLVLEALRSGSTPALYLIDTSNNNVTEFDSSVGSYDLIGWSGHNFLYDLASSSLGQYQPGHEVIKSYDADTAQLNELDSSQANGTPSAYAYNTFTNFIIMGSQLVYTTTWYSVDTAGGSYPLSNQSDSINSVSSSGANKKDYQDFVAANTNGLGAIQYLPQAIYFANYDYSASNNTASYYNFSDQTLSPDTSLSQTIFSQTYPSYLVSPSGDKTFWSQTRDGQNVLFVGDQNAGNSKQLSTNGQFVPYAWYGENYLIVSKNNDQLYILPVAGGISGAPPLLISDYHASGQ